MMEVALGKDDHMVVGAPTGAGKTVIFECVGFPCRAAGWLQDR